MKTYSHYSISMIESFLNSVTMVNVDIKIEHSRVDLQQF